MTRLLILLQIVLSVSRILYIPVKAMGNMIEICYIEPNNYRNDILLQYQKKYYGVYINDPRELDVFENSTSLLGWFDSFEKSSDEKLSICLDQHKYRAFITLEPKGMDLQSIANGIYDSQIIAYLQKLSSGDRVKSNLFVRFAHEMEMRPTYANSWYSWQEYDSDVYVDAWRHVVTLSRTYAPNVLWVWSPNRADLFSYSYYPGGEFVDYVSLTLNNTTDSYKTFEDFYEKNHQKQFLESYNKPIIFGEVAEHCLNKEQKDRYMASVFDYVNDYDKCYGVVFLNKNIDDYRQYRFSDDSQLLETFIDKALQ